MTTARRDVRRQRFEHLAVALGLCAVISLLLGGFGLWVLADRADWQETTGHLVQAEIRSCGRDHAVETEGGPMRFACVVDIAYRYEVGGETWLFEQERRSGGGSSRSDARRSTERWIARQFPPTRVLYHDPADPSQAAAGRGNRGLSLSCMGTGLLLGLGSLLFALVSFRMRPRAG